MSKRSRMAVAVAATLGLFLLGTVSALALINPNFTPNDLVEQSDQILVVKLSKPDEKNRVKMEVVRASLDTIMRLWPVRRIQALSSTSFSPA